VSRELTWLALPMLAIAASAVWQARANARLERELGQLVTRLDHAREPTSAPAQCVASLDPTLLRQEVSRALTGLCPSSVAQPRAIAPAVPSPATANAEDQSPANAVKSDESIKAFDDANRLVDDALARHTWSQRDVEALRGMMPVLDAQARRDVLQRLAQAVNAQQIAVTGDSHKFF